MAYQTRGHVLGVIWGSCKGEGEEDGEGGKDGGSHFWM